MVETIIFIRHAGNLWSIFNSSLIPPTQQYHAKILSFVLLQNHEIFSCLKAKRCYQTYLSLQPALSCHRTVNSKTAEILLAPSPLLFHLGTKTPLPAMFAWLHTFKARLCSMALTSCNPWAGNSSWHHFLTHPGYLDGYFFLHCWSFPFYRGSTYNNLQNPCEQPIIFSVIPPFPQAGFIWSLVFLHTHMMIKSVLHDGIGLNGQTVSLLEHNLSKSMEEESSLYATTEGENVCQKTQEPPPTLSYSQVCWQWRFWCSCLLTGLQAFYYFHYCACFIYALNTTYAKTNWKRQNRRTHDCTFSAFTPQCDTYQLVSSVLHLNPCKAERAIRE